VTHASTDVTPAAEIAAARDLLGRHPLIDGHNDLPWTMRVADELDLDTTDLAAPRAGTPSAAPWARCGPSTPSASAT
jgi:membrane dipeptidase